MFRPLRTVLFLIIGSSADISKAEDASAAIAQARECLKKGDYDGAIRAADEAIKLDPQSAIALFLHGEANGGLRQHNKAIADYDRALKLDPNFLTAINQRGGERFKLGEVKGSIEDFEAYIKIKPKAYDDHWRYGISLYYAGRFADGAKQFKAGEKAFGNDVENVFWHYLCNSRVDGVDKARKSLLPVGQDDRVPMMKVYDLIAGKIKPEAVIETADKADLNAEAKNKALFYAHLYVGLNYEAEGNAKKCREHLTIAVEKHKIGDYMWDVGNVHLHLLKAADGK
jgi:lipoprotein NlpI